MTDPKHDPLHDVISTSPAASSELRARFDEQLNGLIDGRITGARRMRRIVAATVLGVFASLCACALVNLYDAWSSVPRREALLWLVGFGAGFLLLSATIFQYVYEIRSGLAAPRRVAKTAFAIRYGSAFLIVLPIAIPVVARYMGDSRLPLVIFLVTILTVLFWLVTALFAVRELARRYRDDIIIEEKRTQFEIALLRQELAAKSAKT